MNVSPVQPDAPPMMGAVPPGKDFGRIAAAIAARDDRFAASLVVESWQHDDGRVIVDDFARNPGENTPIGFLDPEAAVMFASQRHAEVAAEFGSLSTSERRDVADFFRGMR